jgi:hypothetical protein
VEQLWPIPRQWRKGLKIAAQVFPLRHIKRPDIGRNCEDILLVTTMTIIIIILIKER